MLLAERKRIPTSPWSNSPVANLVRYVPSGVYFARARAGGRLIWSFRQLCSINPPCIVRGMKLCQGQVWKQGKEYIRIVRLERLEVEYKSLPSPASKEGTKHVTSKKDFCRLLKQARPLDRPDPPAP
jgi:hypothetical protein